MSNNLQTFLDRRHLNTLNLTEMGWHESNGKIWYPVYDFKGMPIHTMPDNQPIMRFRALDPTAKPRFGWSRKNASARMFWYPNFQARWDAIQSTGILHLASGETDLLTLIAAGVHNAVALFGETNRFTSADLAKLSELGVRHIVHIIDNDPTGAESSVRQYPIITAAGLEYTAYAPSERFKDLNEQWCNNPDPQALFDNLRPTRFHLTAHAQPQSSKLYDLPKLNAQITAILEQSYKVPHAPAHRYRCPVHNGEDANASWNPETGTLHCFSRCGTHHTLDIIKQAGWNIDLESGENRLPLDATPPTASQPIRPTMPPLPSVPPPPAWEYIPRSQAALANFATMTVGNTNSPLILNPFKTLWGFKGGGYIFGRRKLTGIIAPTGGGKTTFAESIARKLLEAGEDVAFFGFEWSPEEYLIRELVRQMDVPMVDIINHQLWVQECNEWLRTNVGLTEDDYINFVERHPRGKYGKRLSAAHLEKYMLVIAALADETRPQIWYFDRPTISPEQSEQELNRLLEVDTLRNTKGELRAYIVQSMALVRRLRAQGRKITVLFYDYLQLLTVAGRDPFNNVQETTAILKSLAMVLDVHIVVTSQAKKSDTEAIRGEDFTTINANGTVKALDITSGEYMSPTAFNLVLGVVGAYEAGRFLGYVAVQCLKNNTGIAGGKDATVHLYANFERLTVYDKEYPLKLS